MNVFKPGSMLTKRQFTGQRNEMEQIGLYFYNARWYDPSLGRFVLADTIVPGVAQGLDRYAYVLNNPTKYIDPNGHRACVDFDENGQCIPDPDWHKPITIPKPDKNCQSDCWDAYLTYKALVQKLGYVPSMNDILYMTMGSEYWAYVDKPFYYSGQYYPVPSEAIGVPLPRSVGLEAVARQYYEICGGQECSPTDLYKFLSGYQQWAGTSGPTSGGAEARAGTLYTNLSYNHSGTGGYLQDDVDWVMSLKVGEGIEPDSPWQFYREARPPTNLGFSPSNYAILAVDVGGGEYLFMFTYIQTTQR